VTSSRQVQAQVNTEQEGMHTCVAVDTSYHSQASSLQLASRAYTRRRHVPYSMGISHDRQETVESHNHIHAPAPAFHRPQSWHSEWQMKMLNVEPPVAPPPMWDLLLPISNRPAPNACTPSLSGRVGPPPTTKTPSDETPHRNTACHRAHSRSRSL
jgi:hypothetical protein